MTSTTPKNSRKPRQAKSAAQPRECKDANKPTRLSQLEALLTRPSGTTIVEMCEATGWQAHSVRGAMAGALKKRGLTITSEKTDGVRRYHAAKPA